MNAELVTIKHDQIEGTPTVPRSAFARFYEPSGWRIVGSGETLETTEQEAPAVAPPVTKTTRERGATKQEAS